MSQFHYGSIQINRKRICVYPAVRLNSTMVRFKCVTGFLFYQNRKKSQFHYGSIQICLKLNISFYYSASQFHYGSIQIKVKEFNYSDTRGLNSTMVRFKYVVTQTKICFYTFYFNVLFIFDKKNYFDLFFLKFIEGSKFIYLINF